MHTAVQIGIWDYDGLRATRTQALVEEVMREYKINGHVTVNCEPPQLGRLNLYHLLPVIEVLGDYWSTKPDQEFTAEQIHVLFKMLVRRKGIPLDASCRAS